MSSMVLEELDFFRISLLTGMALIWCYLLLLGVRRCIRHSLLAVNIEDGLYWCVVAVLIFTAALKENNGEMRWYCAAAILLGAWIQWGILFFLRRICTKLLKKFKNRGRMT